MNIIRRFLAPLLAVSFATGALLVSPKPAEAENEWFNCRATSVFDDNTKILVSCSNSQSGTSWVAINVADHPAAKVARFVSMANSSVLSGRHFRVFLIDSPTCGFGGCRLATAWGIHTTP